MKNFVMLGVIAITLAGCDAIDYQFDRQVATMTGGASETCIGGVTYLQFTPGATVKVDRDGKPVPC